MRDKLQKIARHPATRKALSDMKPKKTLWSALGIILFFIAPEIIAYFYATEIVHFAQNGLAMQPSSLEKFDYEILIKLFEDGISWFNLGFGVVLLVWLFF
ncbi:hypothetical protein FA592_13385 [Sulfurospirillum diekertiae]|uniref:Uncharacterized protein n=1 Tax=Sulfurospirillum diekertiae TaxID=1854492 RepID=A0A6G9VW56_9BACT|nr:hypothetical protein [Sulfurospirillum diekertiae]QIR77172.1 hypothetical protein FA584_13590 [Sulfurospirillum diekertiae]QIR79786.1 hypothetical protein FA592_13385 [Sulfurospirillum diekertiae]